MRVYAINGVAKAGKDTFCSMVNRYVVKNYRETKTISTIDPIKEIYENQFGWDGDKYQDHHRKNLNTLKQVWISCSNGPHNWTIQKLHDLKVMGYSAVFVMVREYEEMVDILQIGKEFFNHGQSIQIVRFGLPLPPIEKDFIESHPDGYNYDWTIINPTCNFGDMPNLEYAAKFFWENQECVFKTIVNERLLPFEYERRISIFENIINLSEKVK
jgi:hypothetical protein